MPLPSLPLATAQVVDVADYARTEWYDFWRKLREYVEETVTDPEVIEDILQRIAELEEHGSIAPFIANGSVQILGTFASGLIFQLRNDAINPDSDSYYGTNAEGTKGYHPLPESESTVPYFIPADETYTVNVNKQALFSMPINVEGSLVVDGFLVEVP